MGCCLGCCQAEEIGDDEKPLLEEAADAAAQVSEPMVEVLPRLSDMVAQERIKAGWLRIVIQHMDGEELQLLVRAQATILQTKQAVTRAEGTPTFQIHLWAEGAEDELRNGCTAVECGLEVGTKLFLVKGEASNWQQQVLNEPLLAEALEEFMALSMWREAGGYAAAGRLMDAKLAEWEAPSSVLSENEVLRRKTIVARFFIDCCGNYERAIELLDKTPQRAIELMAFEDASGDDSLDSAHDRWGTAPLLTAMASIDFLTTLGDAYKLRETSKLGQRNRGGREGQRASYVNLIRSAKAYERAAVLWRKLPPREQEEEAVAEVLRGVAFGYSTHNPQSPQHTAPNLTTHLNTTHQHHHTHSSTHHTNSTTQHTHSTTHHTHSTTHHQVLHHCTLPTVSRLCAMAGESGGSSSTGGGNLHAARAPEIGGGAD
jgi:hypothetical protein